MASAYNKNWTDFNRYIRRNRTRFLIKQVPKVIWMTGLSGAGKTTLATALEEEIQKKGFFVKIFDGDIIREGINKDLMFTKEDRIENIRRIAEVTKLFLDTGVIIICSFISPTNEVRNMAKGIIGKDRFIEVFVNCPLEICEQRDVKGLYKKVRKGEIKNFTGIDSPYEAPEHPDVEIKTNENTVTQSIKDLVKQIVPKIKYNSK
jgi:adenylylsulfate kinase